MARQLTSYEPERKLHLESPAVMDARAADASVSDLLLLAASPLNLLVVGRDRVTRAVLDQLRPGLRQPVREWRPGDTLALPLDHGTGTLILRDVGTLTADEQTRLIEWMNRLPGRWRVVSTNPTPLFPLVASGRFDDVLYYRLNTMYMDLR